MQTPALAAGKLADDLGLVAALEVEAADVGTRRGFVFAHGEDVVAAGDGVEHGLAVVQRIARLVDVRDFDGAADLHTAAVRLFFAGDHAEQGRFTRAVGADDADDGAGRNLEAEVV